MAPDGKVQVVVEESGDAARAESAMSAVVGEGGSESELESEEELVES